MTLPADPFGRSRLPATHRSRERRVELLHQAARALVAGEPVPADAAAYLGEALHAWLTDGGDLEHRLRVKARRGSHRTPSAILRQLVVQADAASATDATPAHQVRCFRASPHRDERSRSTATVR